MDIYCYRMKILVLDIVYFYLSYSLNGFYKNFYIKVCFL